MDERPMTWHELVEKIINQKKEIERLKKALKDYGKHLRNCNIGKPQLKHDSITFRKNCTCGLQEVLKEK